MSRARHLRPIQCLIVWLVIALVPAHGTALAWIVAKGPSHAHSATASASAFVALVDFRRVAAPAVRVHTHVEGERHFHASADTVQAVGDAWTSVEDSADDGRSGASAGAAFVPLPSDDAIRAVASPARHALARRSGWAVTSASISPLERPPRTERA